MGSHKNPADSEWSMNEGVRWNYSRSTVETEDISNTWSHTLYYHIVTTTRVQPERSTIKLPSLVVKIIGTSGSSASENKFLKTPDRLLLQSFLLRNLTSPCNHIAPVAGPRPSGELFRNWKIRDSVRRTISASCDCAKSQDHLLSAIIAGKVCK